MSSNPSINANDELLFVGTYDRPRGSTQVIPGYAGGNLGVVANIAGVCTISYLSVNFVATQSGLLGGPPLADETYSLVSYPDDLPRAPKLGSLIWSGTYRERLSPDGTTAASIQNFVVTGADGIFTGATEVIVDYNNPIRVFYVYGRKPRTGQL